MGCQIESLLGTEVVWLDLILCRRDEGEELGGLGECVDDEIDVLGLLLD